jgi:excisionase family DNA binding protein
MGDRRVKRIKPLYTIAELCRLTELSRGQIERLLRRNGIRVLQTGCGKRWVPLSEIVEKLDWLEKSLRLMAYLEQMPPK